MPPPPGNPFRQALEQRRAASDPAAAPTANPFASLLGERQKGGKGAPKGESANFVARELAARGTWNALLATPSAGGALLADALKAAEAGVKTAAGVGANNARTVLGMERVQRPTFGERLETDSNAFDQPLRAIPRPTVGGVTAAVGAIPAAVVPGGESGKEAYDRGLAEFEADEKAMRAAHPTAALVGDIAGDVGAVVIGRRASGAGRLVQRLETRLSGRAAIESAETMATDLGKIFTGPAMQRLARGAGRAVETGVEAAALDVLKDESADPIETAALASGGQLIGSGLISGAKGLLSGGPTSVGLKLTVAAASTMGLLQMLKSATPGGRDRILESIEGGYDKVLLALALGAGSAGIGATRYGRGNTALSEQTRSFLDGVATVHRGTLLSVITDWTEGDEKQQATIERVLAGVSADPEGYRPKTDAERAVLRQLRDGAELKADTYETGGGF